MKQLWTVLHTSLLGGRPVRLALALAGEFSGRYGLYHQDGTFLAGEDVAPVEDQGTHFSQWLWPRPGLVIFGAGHVALPVAQIGALLDFEVTVCDDREEFANSGRFPGARVLALPYEEAFERLTINSRHYLVIVTRGHFHDRVCLARALATEAAYIGVIGSPKKAAETRVWLKEQGFTPDQVRRMFSPIGLGIGAKTPGEIAVSILAEIVREKSKRPAPAQIEEIALALATKSAEEVWGLITVVSARGSTPQGAGARMLLLADGRTLGTVGGGLAERLALDAAQEVMAEGKPRLLEYDLDNTLAAQEGMVCGGKMSIFVQPQ